MKKGLLAFICLSLAITTPSCRKRDKKEKRVTKNRKTNNKKANRKKKTAKKKTNAKNGQKAINRKKQY